MTTANPSAAIRALQYALMASGADVRPDGVLGPLTRQAMMASTSPSVQAIGSEHASAFEAKPVRQNRVFVSQAALEQAKIAAVSKHGIIVSAFLDLMYRIENFQVPGGVETTSTGSFRGVAQFSRSSWEDVRNRLDASIGGYDNVMDVGASTLAAAAYFMDNKKIYERKARVFGWTGGFSPELGYLYHQQGPGGAESFLRTGNLLFPKQSRDSLAVVARARQMVV